MTGQGIPQGETNQDRRVIVFHFDWRKYGVKYKKRVQGDLP
jgi:hypothetical protein